MNAEKHELIRRAQSGDLEAFRLIHGDFGRRILNFIHRMVDSREDAEDLAQNTFFRAYQELRGLQDVGKFEAWLYRIARNEVYQFFRHKRTEPAIAEPAQAREEPEPDFELVDGRPDPQERLLQSELGETIRCVLQGLPPKLREVFVLAVIDERSYAEIADITDRSLFAVKTDIFRARGAARKLLGRYLGSESQIE